MTDIFEIELPKDTSCPTRIEWAGERHADLVEGILTDDAGWFVWATIVGWADLCDSDDRRQYLAMAKNFADLLNYRKENAETPNDEEHSS
jgi:hypothetical protein